MDKIELFKKELDYIKSESIRELAENLIEEIPDYFFEVPASSSGKYHPAYTLGLAGLLRHEQAMCKIANALLDLEMFVFDDDTKDLIILACIMHDTRKHGVPKQAFGVANHPSLAARAVGAYEDIGEYLTEEQIELLCGAINAHMGQFNCDYKTKKEILPKPKNKVENFVFLCDYLASRKYITVDLEESNEPKDYRVGFGKYAGKTIGTIYSMDQSYFNWLSENAKDKEMKAKIAEFLEKKEEI